MCVLSIKVPIRKKSGIFFNDPYIYIYIYIYILTYSYIHIYTDMYIHIDIYMHTCKSTYMYKSTRRHMCIHMHTHMYMHIVIYIHTYIYIYTHMYIYVWVCVCVLDDQWIHRSLFGDFDASKHKIGICKSPKISTPLVYINVIFLHLSNISISSK